MTGNEVLPDTVGPRPLLRPATATNIVGSPSPAHQTYTCRIKNDPLLKSTASVVLKHFYAVVRCKLSSAVIMTVKSHYSCQSDKDQLQRQSSLTLSLELTICQLTWENRTCRRAVSNISLKRFLSGQWDQITVWIPIQQHVLTRHLRPLPISDKTEFSWWKADGHTNPRIQRQLWAWNRVLCARR